MLVLSRRPTESLIIDGGIRITVVSVRGSQVRLGIEAPDDVRIHREELRPVGGGRGGERPSTPTSAPSAGIGV